MKRLAAPLIALFTAGASLFGCELIAQIDRSKIPENVGGAGGGTGGTGGVAGMGGQGGTGGAPCTDPSKDCPDPGTTCVIAACDMGACSMTNATVDTVCNDNGGAFCDGNGNCVTCNSGAQCPDPMNECVLATCDMGSCGTSNVADGTATVAGQITGDCKQQVCDGSGGTKVIDDDMDPNDDMNDCTADTCSVGVNVHTPISGACTQNGGSVCADPLGPKAGTCVACNVDADCTVMGEVCDPQFGTNTCVNAACTDTAKNGDETDVDCGGSCAPCPNTKLCLAAGDCQSGFCNAGVCEACTADANCGATQFCGTATVGTNGVCTDDLGDGSACTATSQCTSGNCVDGFCCDTACSGTCDACSATKKGQGLDGVCGPVANGQDPDNDCAQDAASSCQMTGVCNGMSACALHPLGTVCAAQSCVGGVQSNQDTCNGTGTCVDGGTVPCGTFNCNAAGTTCLTTCTGDVDCATGNFCNGLAQCVAKLGNGSACTGGNQCSSANCVDGVCCNSACGGLCQACNVAGSLGACTSIPNGTDPANECVGTTDCNGSGACTSLVNGAACTLAAECGSGNCVDGVCCNTACGATCQACNVAGNVGACTAVPVNTDPANECTGTDVCNGSGACTKVNGSACALGTECLSGNCIDGVCCNTACGATCQACNVAGSIGTCSNVPNGTDPANECAGATNCNGSGACGTLPNGSACTLAAECTSNNCIDGFCCNTACGGTCQACDVAGNQGTCSNVPSNTDPANECAGSDVCNGAGACIKANGSACGAGAECLSGNCIDGVCCNTGCGGLCQACNVAGNAGTCTPIPAGQDPANECAGPINCDGAGSCGLAANGTACSTGAECQSGNCTDNFCCNTACSGTCESCAIAGSVGACTPFAAGTDPFNECLGGQVCNGASACVALADGSACLLGTDCMSGNCIDGVCCNTTCGGLCQACNVAGSVGTCTNVPNGQDPAFECAGGQVCNGAGACTTLADGTACSAPADCTSGNCVDGVCCNTACGGTCDACNLAGFTGTCTPITAGLDPANECAAPYECGGASSCQTCSDGVMNGNETDTDCGGGGACGTCANGDTCIANSDCTSNNCVLNVCQPPAAVCPNGVIESGETCDDNNGTNGDGCSSVCQCEATQIVTANPSPDTTIPDNVYVGTIATMGCVPVVVPTVTGCPANVTSLSVTLGMAHTWVGDLVIKLIHPDNTVVTLMSRPGVVETADDGNDTAGVGDSSNLVKTHPITFQMGAAVSAENMGNTITSSGNVCQNDSICTFAPANGAAAPGDLNSFNGKPAAGTWQLCIGDGGSGDTGTIDVVTLTIGK